MSGTEEIQQPKYVDFSEYILFQVRRTQSLIRQTDLMLLVASVVSVVLFLLIGFILLDHWAFSQGLSHPLRWLGFWGITGSILTAIIYYWRTTAGKTITRLFAARTLEKADQKFDNNLMTLIDLQANGKETSPLIQSSLEKRAAITLNDLDVEHVVDRKSLLHRLYALLIGTVLIFGYAFLTPKSVSDSVWRIMFPWTTTTAPTTTQIFDVEPGNVTVTAGTHVEVSAYIDGKIPEAVWLVYSTEDRRIIDERVQMQETEDGLGKFIGIINGENGKGVDQPTSYYLLAGDGRSASYQIAVSPAPHTTIREVRITPPAYTKRTERAQQTGSLDAIEGSAITLIAESNIPIKKSWIQLYDTEDPSSRSGQLPLTITEEKQITGDWILRIRDDGTYPRFYRIECETADGSRDLSPPLHAILVRPDERPEVRLIDPTSDLVRPINVTVPLLIEAFDPDFLLSGLSIQVEKQGKIIASELIDAHDKQSLRTRYPLELQRLPIKPGDEISFWVEARDNRQPHPNRRNTSKLRIRILDPVDEQQAKKQEQEDKQKQKEIEKKRNEQQENPASEDPADEQNQELEHSDNSEKGTDETMQKDSPESGEPSKTGNNNENSDKNSESNENKNSENTGDKTEQSDEPGDDSEKKSNPKPGEKGEQHPANNSDSNSEKKEADEPQFSPDGDDDDQVLKKMIDKMQEKEQQNQKKQGNDPSNPDGQNSEDSQTNPSDPKKEQTPKNGQNPENPSSDKPGDKNENNPQKNGDNNPEQKMNDKQPGDDPNQKQPGDKDKAMQPGEKEDSSKEPGDKKNNEKSGDEKSKDSEQKGTEPGEKSGDQNSETMQKTPGENEKPGENSKPGQADKPDPNSKQPGQEPRQPEPGEKPAGEMKPGKKPGKGESTPGKGDEKGPTELEKKKPGEQPPQSQNPSQKPGDDKSGKPSDSKPSDQKSAKPGEKPADAPGKKNENKNSPEKMGNKPTDSENKPTQKPGEKPNGTKPTPEKNPSGNKPPKPGKKNDNKPEGKPTTDKPNSEKPDQKPGDKKNQQNNKGDDKGADKAKGDKPGEKPSKGKSDQPGKGSGKPQQSNKPPSEAGEPAGKGGAGNKPGVPHTDKPGSASSGPGMNKQGKPNAQSQQSGVSDSDKGEDQYSLEDRKKAAELVLDKLEKELKRGEVDSELLEELGWDKDNLKQFQQRLADYLRHQKEDGEPNLKEKQFEEMLKNMRLTGKGKSRSGSDAGTTSSDEFAPVITPPPPEYRDISQAFKKSLSKSKSKQPK